MSQLPTVLTDQLTKEMLVDVLPDKLKKSVNDELINEINTVLSNPAEYEAYRDNLIGYTHVLTDGKYKLTSYIDAVRYVSFKLMGHTNDMAFKKTFPKKYQEWVMQGVAPKDIASYITAYNKGKLVNAIYAQSMIPTHVLNQDVFQKAINVQAELMLSAQSEKVRSDAANSLLTHLKAPEVKQIEMNIGVQSNDDIKNMSKAILELAAMQKQAITGGVMNAQEIAHTKIIDVEAKEVK